MSRWFVFRRRLLWIIRNDDHAALTPSVVELMSLHEAAYLDHYRSQSKAA